MEKVLMLGNEAVIRGALEAGLSFATTYPGTPASEIGDTLAKNAKEYRIYFEYSANEKIALEAAAGAAFSGLKSMVAMKHYGLNVALDSLLPLAYLKCPLVVIVADDPGCWSSIQTEQDSRWFSRLGLIPTLEPADAQETKEMTKFAFRLAEKYKIPVLVRMTTRAAHTRSLVELGKIIPAQKIGKFIKDPEFTVGAQPTIDRHEQLIKKIEKIKKEISEETKFNYSENKGGETVIIASGVCFFYVQEVLKELNIKLPIFKLGLSYPLPEEKIKKFISAKGGSAFGGKSAKEILVVEENDPIIERTVARLAKDVNPKLKIYGKNLLPTAGEMRPEYVFIALGKILNRPVAKELISQQKLFAKTEIKKRLPTLCPGCPHRATFWEIKQTLGKNNIFGSDIGCYLLGALPPVKLSDYNVAMGAGIGISHGVSKATQQKPIIFIGDATFFHAGLPAVVNLVYNKSDVLLVILDKNITAMTGHQTNPGVGLTGSGEETKALKIEDIIKTFGVDQVETINVYNFADSVEKIKKLYQAKGVSIIVAKGECRLLTVRKMARSGVRTPKFEIIKQSPALEQLKEFGCPAIRKSKGKYYIEENMCWGCGFCQQLSKENIKLKQYEQK